MFVAIEGIDAAGKATQAALAAGHLRTCGWPHAEVRSFPDYSTKCGRIIREMLYGRIRIEPQEVLDPAVKAHIFQSLIVADRLTQLHDLERAVENGLVADRYTLSGIAYGMIEGLDRAWLERALLTAAPEPDLWIFIDVSIPEIERRLRIRAEQTGRPLDRNEIDSDKLARVRQMYLDLFEDPPSALFGSFFVIDGERSREEVASIIAETISEELE